MRIRWTVDIPAAHFGELVFTAPKTKLVAAH
jgi:hypothetical protein